MRSCHFDSQLSVQIHVEDVNRACRGKLSPCAADTSHRPGSTWIVRVAMRRSSRESSIECGRTATHMHACHLCANGHRRATRAPRPGDSSIRIPDGTPLSDHVNCDVAPIGNLWRLIYYVLIWCILCGCWTVDLRRLYTSCLVNATSRTK